MRNSESDGVELLPVSVSAVPADPVFDVSQRVTDPSIDPEEIENNPFYASHPEEAPVVMELKPVGTAT